MSGFLVFRTFDGYAAWSEPIFPFPSYNTAPPIFIEPVEPFDDPYEISGSLTVGSGGAAIGLQGSGTAIGATGISTDGTALYGVLGAGGAGGDRALYASIIDAADYGVHIQGQTAGGSGLGILLAQPAGNPDKSVDVWFLQRDSGVLWPRVLDGTDAYGISVSPGGALNVRSLGGAGIVLHDQRLHTIATIDTVAGNDGVVGLVIGTSTAARALLTVENGGLSVAAPGSADAYAADIGSMRVTNAIVATTLSVGNSLAISGTLTVGAAGIKSDGPLTILRTSVDERQISGDVIYHGSVDSDHAGFSLASGDIDGDGIIDLVIGANTASNPSGPNDHEGETYIIYGPLPESGIIDLGMADVVYYGKGAFDESGSAVALGDINNDGIMDLAIGAWYAFETGSVPDCGSSPTRCLYDGSIDPATGLPKFDGLINEGETYIIYGPLPVSGIFDLNDPAVVGISYHGMDADDYSGSALGLGDLNGDGIDDLAIGAPLAENAAGGGGLDEGELYVLYGPIVATTTGAMLNLGGSGIVDKLFFGKDAQDRMANAVAIGDLNGDFINELIIGAYAASIPSGPNDNEGETNVIFGPLPGGSVIDLDTAGVVDVSYFGKDANDYSGKSVAMGDFNNDGYVDLAIGASREYANSGQGEIYIVPGPIPASGLIDLDDRGVVSSLFYGIANTDRFGAALVGVDINGDSLDDLVAGAYRADSVLGPDNSKGEVYVLYGNFDPTAAYFGTNVGVGVRDPEISLDVGGSLNALKVCMTSITGACKTQWGIHNNTPPLYYSYPSLPNESVACAEGYVVQGIRESGGAYEVKCGRLW